MKVNKVKYRNRVANDLFFLIDSESMIQEYPEIQLPDEEIDKLFRSELDSICTELDSNSTLLFELEKARNLRLGIYCENLMYVFLNLHPKIEVLERNWQIIREGVTIGELDFIFKMGERIIGFEMAFKCYAHFESGIEGWMGPKKKDSLVAKLNKVKNHQLPLFDCQEVKEKYGEVESFLFLKGHLFSNLSPKNTGLKEAEFHFLSYSEIECIRENQVKYYLFPKSAWVSDIYYSKKEYQLSFDEIQSLISKEKESRKSFIVGIRSKTKLENYLLVESIK